jgi:hypothetical protein
MPRLQASASGARRGLQSPAALGALVAMAIILAILSLPSSLAELIPSLERALGPAAPLIALALGLLHGLKPDEHTWPITVPYALAQRDLRRGLLAAVIFTSALTAIWTPVAGLAALAKQELLSEKFTPVVDMLTGFVMLLVALYLLLRRNGHAPSLRRPSFRAVWIHGLTAAFGGDFIAVLAYTVALSGSYLAAIWGWMIGLLFGLGTMASQSFIAYMALRSSEAIEARLRGSLLAEGSTYSLGFLGAFLILLGLFAMG